MKRNDPIKLGKKLFGTLLNFRHFRPNLHFFSSFRKFEQGFTVQGYCAKSTECSDHNFKKTTKCFQIIVVFFWQGAIK